VSPALAGGGQGTVHGRLASQRHGCSSHSQLRQAVSVQEEGRVSRQVSLGQVGAACSKPRVAAAGKEPA
jgi:hypothetical protein